MTLQAKIHNRSQLGHVGRNVKSMLEGLKVRIGVLRADSRGWVGVSVSGEDEKVALRYLADNIGFCPVNLADVGRFFSFKGFLMSLTGSRSEVQVDLGISFPTRVDAAVPLNRLQAQVGDGRKVALGKLAELFGFCQDLPLSVRVLKVDLDGRRVEAELSEGQQRRYRDWAGSLLDRLLILGASYGEVEAAVRAAQVGRDVVGVESLGMFEHALVCKLGTDAAGLIPKVGRVLPRSTFSVFSPSRVLAFLGQGWVSSGF